MVLNLFVRFQSKKQAHECSSALQSTSRSRIHYVSSNFDLYKILKQPSAKLVLVHRLKLAKSDYHVWLTLELIMITSSFIQVIQFIFQSIATFR
jgi:hypothetical protein